MAIIMEEYGEAIVEVKLTDQEIIDMKLKTRKREIEDVYVGNVEEDYSVERRVLPTRRHLTV